MDSDRPASQERQRFRTSPLLISLALFALYVIWGSTFFAVRIALETVPPLLSAGPRLLVAGLALYLVLRARGAGAPTRRQWIASAQLGLLLLTVSNGALALAQQSVSSGVAAIVVASAPIWTAVLARIRGIRASRRDWAGLVLGFSGIVLLNIGGEVHADARGLMLLVTPLAWALGTVLSTTLPLPTPAMASAAQMMTGGLLMVILAVLAGERLTHLPSLRSLLAMMYLSVFGSIVALWAYNWLLSRVRPALATSHAYVNPIIALFIGWMFGGETMTITTLAAAAIGLAGVVVIARQ